ncbi:MAG: DUF389 domain-containing protein [Flavobacteriales bacterium]
MSELNQENQVDPEIQKEKINRSGKLFFKSLWSFIQDTLSLKEGIDKPATIEGIKHDVVFKGHAAWILVCSIMIASIGLSTGNVPILVGAMLISPLMGPILGVGLAAGTNDFELLVKSLKNFGVAVVISIFISWLYFLIIPQPDINIELEGRKEATLLAIAVAFFGGAAGIIAGSRSLKSNVVPGVAIATALMPPLCTVGFGLATMRWDFVTGALYLFGINSVFIALPTYLYIKYLKFPVKEFVDPIRERKIKRVIVVFIFLIMIPSAYIFYDVLQVSFFQRDANAFLVELEQSLEATGTSIIDQKIIYSEDKPSIKIALMGDPISKQTEATWQTLMLSNNLQNCDLQIRRPKDYTQEIEDLKSFTTARTFEQSQMMFQSVIDEKDKTIRELNLQIERKKSQEIDFKSYYDQVRLLTLDVSQVAFAKIYQQGISSVDTIPTFFITWKPGTDESKVLDDSQLIKRWFVSKMKDERVQVVNHSIE